MFQWEKEHLKGVRYNADQYPDDQFLYWGNDWRLVTSYHRTPMNRKRIPHILRTRMVLGHFCTHVTKTILRGHSGNNTL